MMRLLALTVALLLAGPVAFAADPYPPRITYAISRDGQQIGRYLVTFGHKGPLKVVSVDCQVEVKTLGVAAYRYSHRAREEWNADQLQSLQSQTDDNGKKYTVAVERRGDELVVERTAPAQTATA